MDWTFVYLMIGLKIPIIGLAWIVWRAVHDVDDPEEAGQGDGRDGGTKDRVRHPRRPFPRSPRRGPHGDPALAPPARTRSTVAKARHGELS